MTGASTGKVKAAIENKLSAALNPVRMVVTDQSHLHAGHSGHSSEHGETHFDVEVVSDAFAGKTRLERHRLVNDALSEELAGPVHALALTTKTPGELS